MNMTTINSMSVKPFLLIICFLLKKTVYFQTPDLSRFKSAKPHDDLTKVAGFSASTG
jgi:hypothetical protein